MCSVAVGVQSGFSLPLPPPLPLASELIHQRGFSRLCSLALLWTAPKQEENGFLKNSCPTLFHKNVSAELAYFRDNWYPGTHVHNFHLN